MRVVSFVRQMTVSGLHLLERQLLGLVVDTDTRNFSRDQTVMDRPRSLRFPPDASHGENSTSLHSFPYHTTNSEL